MKINALKGRLVIIVSTIFLLAWLTLSILVVFSNRDIDLMVTDALLQQDAELIALFVKDIGQKRGENGTPSWSDQVFATKRRWWSRHLQHNYGRSFQVWYDGRQLLSTASRPTLPAPDQEGFSTVTPPNSGKIDTYWRVYVYRDRDYGFWVMTVQSLSAVDELAWSLLFDHLWPIVLIAPLTALAFFWGVSRGLKPLSLAAHQIARREPNDLRPINLEAIPSEVFPLLQAINNLMQQQQAALERVDQALVNEKRFTAHAAHELLTPLSAIKTEAQLQALAVDQDDRGRSEALEEICHRVDRATHTVEQLVTLARLEPEWTREPPTLGHPPTQLDLVKRLQECAAQYGEQIDAKAIDFELIADGQLMISGVDIALSVLIRNLLDNAVRYVPPGGKIRICAQEESRQVRLTVTNSGRCLPDYLKDRIFERFVRGPDEVETGSGLGLSIVRRAAEIHGAKLSTGVPTWGEGVRFDVLFPPPASP